MASVFLTANGRELFNNNSLLYLNSYIYVLKTGCRLTWFNYVHIAVGLVGKADLDDALHLAAHSDKKDARLPRRVTEFGANLIGRLQAKAETPQIVYHDLGDNGLGGIGQVALADIDVGHQAVALVHYPFNFD